MNLVDKLREITKGLGWQFYYGRRDFQNLIETESENDNTNYFFLDPVRRSPEYSNDSGMPTGEIYYTGYFMVLTKSDLDQTYDNQDSDKWTKHIKPKLDKAFQEFQNNLICVDELQIVRFDVTDAINVFSENFDGILVNYKIKEYL